MATAVDVCNLALSHFGEQKINALDAGEAATNENAARCLVYYDQARAELLERQSWTFARTRTALTKEVATPPFDWSYQHTLPTNCLRVLEVRSGSLDTYGINVSYDPPVDGFEIENGKLLSNHEYLALRYIFDDGPEGWTSLAVAALARLLASYLAESITGDPKRAEYHRRLYEEVDLPTAQHHDAVQDQSNENHPLEARLAGSILVQRRRLGVTGTGFDQLS